MEDKFLKVAKQAAVEAGKVIMSFYGQDHKLMIKTDHTDFATQADLAAEKTIVGIITKNFPSHNIIAEEKVRINNRSTFTWAIDPVDGTISFASKMPFFAVSIGLLENNQPVLGVIYHVTQNDLYWAEIGKGAYLNGRKIAVSKTNKLKNSVIGLGIGGMSRRKDKLKNYFYPLLEKVRYIYMLGGGAVSLAFVARGFLDALPNTAWIWDQAAGGIIITEAGGKVSDRSGNPVDWSADKAECIASNGLVHNEVLEALKK
ncbi:MAG: inositol monophosphatase family protein [Candidatus Daviesbacteria bacterium]|nr:inositol monophosphatase family protein [Candidatus Daviesbacteria bacterium]